MIDKWKVITSYLTYDHAGRADKDGKRRILSTMEVLPPKTICTETYLLVDAFESETYAINAYMYLTTKFARYLIMQASATQHLSKSSFVFVPILDFSENWTDSKLYSYFSLTVGEIAVIETAMKEM